MTALQLFDALPTHIEDALRASIERFGVLVPVVKDQHGRTIDGHHRSRIADRVGVKYRVDVVQVADDDEALAIARSLNTVRRHLTGEQLREHIVMLAQRATPAGVGELSQHEIARVAGVSQPYVNKVLSDPELITSNQLPQSRRGADGKVRPASRPTVVPAKNEREAERAQQALTTVLRRLSEESGVLALCVLYRIAEGADRLTGCRCEPGNTTPGCQHGIDRFRVRKIGPGASTTKWRIFTPAEYREALLNVRLKHVEAEHTAWEVAA